MGIHLINFRDKEGKFESYYFEDYDHLVRKKFDFPDSAIVYEAERKWEPKSLKEHPVLSKYTNRSARVGRRAELLFQKMAEEYGYVAQAIDQDAKRYKSFIAILGENTKRSDFIILNLSNVEVDVKCFSLQEKKGGKYYRLEKEEISKYETYSRKTDRKLIFAIYQRYRHQPVRKSLGMVELSDLKNLSEEVYREKSYLKLPVEKLKRHFDLFESLKDEKKGKVIFEEKAGRV